MNEPEAIHIPEQPTPSSRRCHHRGHEEQRCGSPALRGERFCYYHHETRRPAAALRQRRARQVAFSLAVPNSRAEIQQALGEIMLRIASNDIDLRRAGLLLYALQTANSNLTEHQRQNAQPKAALQGSSTLQAVQVQEEFAKSKRPQSHPVPEQKRPAEQSSQSELNVTRTNAQLKKLPSQPDPEQKCHHPEQTLSKDDETKGKPNGPQFPAHPESTPEQKCHPERSAAESKDLRLTPQPEPTPPNVHYGSGSTPDLTHSEPEPAPRSIDFTPPPPVWRRLSKATGAALLETFARSEGAESLPDSPEDHTQHHPPLANPPHPLTEPLQLSTEPQPGAPSSARPQRAEDAVQ